MTLFDFIKNHQGKKLLLASETKTLNVEDILTESYKLSPFLFGFYGKTVALDFQNNFELAKWMIFVDGLAKRVTIIPTEISSDNRSTFLTLSETEIVISDRDIQLAGLNVYNVNYLNIQESLKPPLPQYLETEWVITTSGTTGSPKLVKHTIKSLTNTVKKGKEPNNNTWGLLYGLHRFAGIQVFLQALTSCNTLVITETEEILSKKIIPGIFL